MNKVVLAHRHTHSFLYWVLPSTAFTLRGELIFLETAELFPKGGVPFHIPTHSIGVPISPVFGMVSLLTVFIVLWPMISF